MSETGNSLSVLKGIAPLAKIRHIQYTQDYNKAEKLFCKRRSLEIKEQTNPPGP